MEIWLPFDERQIKTMVSREIITKTIDEKKSKYNENNSNTSAKSGPWEQQQSPKNNNNSITLTFN